jgi:hypothetical protein
MSKHLKPTDISAIVELIRGWTGNKLTWELVCDVVAPLIQDTTTRQTLNSHPEIKSAFASKKKGLRIHGPRTAVPIQPRITKGTYMAYWYREAVCCHACCDCIPAPISGWFA